MTSHRLTSLLSTPTKFQNPPPTCRGVSLQGWPHMHRQHIKVLKHFVYIQYGCGIQSEDCCSLSFDIMTSHRLTPSLQSTHKIPKSTPNLQRGITARVAQYAYRQHIKVPKHFVYIQYGCGIQSEDCCSLSFDIMTSHRLTPGLQSTHKIPKSNPTCRGVSLQGWTHMHRQHIKVPKHFVYIQYGCGIQSEACCGLHFDTMTSLLGSGLSPKTPKSTPDLQRRITVRVAP